MLTNELQFALNLATRAGEIMLHYFDANVEERIKGDQTLVTAADEAINAIVIEEVEKEYPAHSVFGEEASAEKASRFAWVCDPIDGTVPFAKGLPISVFSLALVEDGQPILGVIFDPFTKRHYHAIKGQGAFLNDQPIKVSSKGLGHLSIIDIEWWPEAPYDIDTAYHKLSVETGTYVLHLGTIIQGVCRVASGQFEACIFPSPKNVDIAAAKVIVEEAGGKVTDLFGNEQRYDQPITGAIISNGVVHADLVRLAEHYR